MTAPCPCCGQYLRTPAGACVACADLARQIRASRAAGIGTRPVLRAVGGRATRQVR